MSKGPKSCSGDAIPMLRLSLERVSCLRSQGEKVSTADGAAALIQRLYGCDPQEHFFAIFLSASGEVLGIQTVGAGGLGTVQVDPRILFGGALAVGSTAVVLVHNHPSGSLEASSLDHALTRNLIEGARILGLRITDHIIVTAQGHTSMRAQGQVPFDG